MSKTLRISTALVALSLIGGGIAYAAAPRITPPAGTPAATTHLNPNTATQAQLSAIPGLSAAIATDIVRGRPYANQAAFHKVVGAKVAAAAQPAVYAAVFLPIDLNNTSVEEINTIPGMTPQMVREFQEYKPFKDMDVFKREIGKYVDATELARLASYVTVK